MGKRKFTESQAVDLVMKNSVAERSGNKLISVEWGSVRGLKTCGAIDFLNNHTQVNVVFKSKKGGVVC